MLSLNSKFSGQGGTDSAMAIGRWGGGSGGRINIVHSRAAIGSNTVTNDGDEIGVLNFIPDNGTNLNTVAASIQVVHNGTFSTVVPTDLILSTSSDSSANVEGLRIDSGQRVRISNGSTAAAEQLLVEFTDDVTDGIRVLGGAATTGNPAITIQGGTTSRYPSVRFKDFAGTQYGQIGLERGTSFVVGASQNDLFIDAEQGLAFSVNQSLKMELDTNGTLFIGDTANAKMTVGLTINQGANDNEILALKSSDVAHGMTGLTETDTYGYLQKQSATGGGLLISGYSDSGAATTDGAVHIHATTDNVDTTDTSASGGSIIIDGMKKSGTSRTLLGATENIIAIRAGSTARMLLKGNGDMHITNTTLVALDDEDDIALVRAYQKESSSGIGIAMSKWDEGLKANRADLIRTGVWSSEGDFTVQQRMNDLLGGAIWQMNTKHMSLAEEVKSLKAEIKALTEGK